MSSANIRALVREISDLKRQVNGLSATSSLKFSTVEQGGAITIREPILDQFGEPALSADGIQLFREVASFGAQWDGSYAAAPLTSGQLPPPTPSTPIVIPVPNGLVIKWDGLFTDSEIAPMNFSRIETHLDTEMNFDSNFAETIVGTTSSPRASYVVVQGLEEGVTYYAKLVARDQAGARGPDSGENFAAPLPPATDAETQAAIQRAIEGAEAAQAAAQTAQDTAETAQTTADGAQQTAETAKATADTARQESADAKRAAELSSADAIAARDAAVKAQADATTALQSANGKSKIWYSTVDPTSSQGADGDTWYKRSSGAFGVITGVWEKVSGTWQSRAMSNSTIDSLSAGKITSGTLGVGQIITVGEPTPGGSYLTIGNSMITTYRQDRDGLWMPALQLGAEVEPGDPLTYDQLQLVDPITGESLVGMDASGIMWTDNLVATDLTVGGYSFGDIDNPDDTIFQFARGRVAGYIPPKNSPQANSELGIAEVSFDILPNRLYKITFDGQISGNAPDSTWRLFLRYTLAPSEDADAPSPLVGSATQLSMGFFNNSASSVATRCHLEGFIFYGSRRQCRVLVSLQRIGGGFPSYYYDGRGYLYVDDVGPVVSSSADVWGDGQMTVAGGTPYTPPSDTTNTNTATSTTTKKTYTKTYNATWSQSYSGSGGSMGTSELRQGDSGSYGQMKSAIGFPSQVQADLSGAAISRMEVYLYANHWYYNSGGTLMIGTHTSSSQPSSFPTSSQVASKKWSSKTGGQWITLPSSIHPYWTSGNNKGITIGVGAGSSNTYYARLNGVGMPYPPKLRVTYTK